MQNKSNIFIFSIVKLTTIKINNLSIYMHIYIYMNQAETQEKGINNLETIIMRTHTYSTSIFNDFRVYKYRNCLGLEKRH